MKPLIFISHTFTDGLLVLLISMVPRPALRAARLKRKAENEEVGNELPMPKAKAKAKGKAKAKSAKK